MIESQDGLSTTTAFVDTAQIFYDDLGENLLGYTRVLKPAPRLVVINAYLKDSKREQQVLQKLLTMQQPPPKNLAEEISPPPVLLRGHLHPSLPERMMNSVIELFKK